MRILDFLKKKAKKTTGLYPGGSPEQEERETLISDPDEVRRFYLRLYGVWQSGDSNVIANFYARANGMDMNYEPWYWKNLRSSFWSTSMSEDDIKRTTSGIAPAITYTLSNLIGKPTYKVGVEKGRAVHRKPGPDAEKDPEAEYQESLTKRLAGILDEQSFWSLYETQKTCTLYQGWGCYKVTWDRAVSDHPYAVYYKAEDVDFIWKAGRLVSVIFRDWYQDADNIGQRYLVTETRTLVSERDAEGRMHRSVQIETEAFRQTPTGGGEAELTRLDGLDSIPELKGVEQKVVIRDFTDLWAYPTVLFDDDQSGDVRFPGRSIHCGKIDLYDDLDMCLSQDANAVTKSTPVEYFNSDFLERDGDTQMPKMPHRYDRKYIAYDGGKSVDGSALSPDPVQVTQPNVNFAQYSQQAIETMKMILTGLLSPATMGIDVARQSTAESMREKEKITISTTNHMQEREAAVLKKVFSGLLCAEEYLCTGQITRKRYDITVKFDSFAAETLGEKMGQLGEQLDNGNISPEMYLDQVYGDTLSDADYDAELGYLKMLHDPETQMKMQKEAQEEDQDDPLSQAMGAVQDENGSIDPGAMASTMGGGAPNATGIRMPRGDE